MTLQWYHCLIPSFLLHILVFILVLYILPDDIDLHIFFHNIPYQSIQIPSMTYIYTIPEETPSSEFMNQTESMDPDYELFETPQEVVPEIPEFHFPPRETESSENPEIQEPPDSNISQNTKNPSVPSGTISDTPSTVSGGAVHSQPVVPDKATTPPQVRTDSGSEAKKNIDLEELAWKKYTKVLSNHFKARKYYPELARKMRLSGTVWITMEISRDGTIISAKVTESSGHAILDQAALQSAKSASPVPAFPSETQDAVKTVRIPYHYQLK